MPTYINNSNKAIYLEYDNTIIKPKETKITRAFYDNIPELQLLDIKPYETPIILSKIETIDASQQKEYNVYNAMKIVIIPIDSKLKIYLHENKDNGNNVILILPHMNYTITNRNKFLRTIYVENPNSTNASYYITIYNNLEDYF